MYDRYQILQVYMAFGGIRFYLERIRPEWSPAQNINALCFERNAVFRDEYINLYALYQLVDLYTLFYLKFISQSDPDDENFWINAVESPMYGSWSGYAFEMVGLHHVREIKNILGIAGVQTSVYAWSSGEAQIDLVIDRKDQVFNLFEMKFSIRTFSIDKRYAAELRDKIGSLKESTGSKKAVFISFLSTFGLAKNEYSGMVQNDLSLNDEYRTANFEYRSIRRVHPNQAHSTDTSIFNIRCSIFDIPYSPPSACAIPIARCATFSPSIRPSSQSNR